MTLLAVNRPFQEGGGNREGSNLIVYTEVPAEADPNQLFPENSRIVAVDPANPAANPQILTPGFAAARAPEISFDGKRLLFAGRTSDSSAWQIWERPLDGGTTRRFAQSLEGCADPTYLPGGLIAFSAMAPILEDRPEEGRTLALFTSGLDGCCLERISFHPDADYASVALRDNRILFASNRSGPSNGPSASQLLAMRYDGTGVELYYESQEGAWLPSRARETEDRRLIFVEKSDRDAQAGRLVSVRDDRPLHSYRDLAPSLEGFHSVYPAGKNRWIVSYRDTEQEPFALYMFDPETGELGARLTHDEKVHAVEPVEAAPRFEPESFVSIVDSSHPAELYAMDADRSTLVTQAPGPTVTIRIRGVTGVLADVPVHSDGSFRLEVPHDTPLRFETLNDAGEVVRGPSQWLWVRPNERRGCIGCHENRELVPDNLVKQAFDEPAVSLLPD